MGTRFVTFLFEAWPRLPKHVLVLLWNFYPPFFFAGIRIRWVAPDFTSAVTSLRLRWWNRNYIGTLFGGSMYSMCDPLHMVMLMELLGPGYIVRDKGAEIRFLKKGLGRVTARFEITPKQVAEIWNDAAETQERRFTVQVRDEAEDVVCEVVKVLHIRRTGASAG